jgi:very-short-patch-repair endonuclease
VAKSDNEAAFDMLWKVLGGPPLEEEYIFAPPRKWRFDRAHVASRVAIEIEGFGHERFNRFHSDIDKYNAASFGGWRLFRIHGSEIQKGRAIETLERIIKVIGGEP